MNKTIKVKIENNWVVVVRAPASHRMGSVRRRQYKELR